jgi:hypothetical protein
MSFHELPECLQDLVTMFAFGANYKIIKYDIERCQIIQDCIPPSFLVAVVFYKYRWGYVNSPFRAGNGYYPSWLIDYESVWNGVPTAFVCMICKERIRQNKTYKGIIFRRISEMLGNNFREWNSTYESVFSKLNDSHFRVNSQRSFREEILYELSEASPLPPEFFDAPS